MKIRSNIMLSVAASAVLTTAACTTDPETGERRISKAAIGGIGGVLGGYLLGSVPFGVILTWAGGAGDLRAVGSGNIGATNVLRTGRKGLAAATLLLDLLKGAAAVWLARALGPGEELLAAAGAAAAPRAATAPTSAATARRRGVRMGELMGMRATLAAGTVLLLALAWRRRARPPRPHR